MYIYRNCNIKSCEFICKKCNIDYWDCKCFLEYGKGKYESLIFKCLSCEK